MIKLVSSKAAIASVVLIIGIAVIGFFALNSGSVTGKATASNTTKELTSPSKTLGNYYQYSNQDSSVDGKVRVLFIGAEFCPFCAAQRWPLVESLKEFGQFGELRGTTSAEIKDMPSNLATYHLVGLDYKSNYVRFDHKEIQDRNFNELEKLSDEEASVFNKYNSKGDIPFLMIAGKKGVYVQISSGYSPGTLSGLSFSDIKSDLENNKDTQVSRSINQETNLITALICYNNDNKPASVCNNPEIRDLVSQLR